METDIALYVLGWGLVGELFAMYHFFPLYGYHFLHYFSFCFQCHLIIMTPIITALHIGMSYYFEDIFKRRVPRFFEPP